MTVSGLNITRTLKLKQVKWKSAIVNLIIYTCLFYCQNLLQMWLNAMHKLFVLKPYKMSPGDGEDRLTVKKLLGNNVLNNHRLPRPEIEVAVEFFIVWGRYLTVVCNLCHI